MAIPESKHRRQAIVVGMNCTGPFSEQARKWIETGEGSFPTWERLAKALMEAEEEGMIAGAKVGSNPLESALLFLEKHCNGKLWLENECTYDIDPESVIEAAAEHGWTPAEAN